MGLMSDGTYEVMQRLADAQSRRRFVQPAPKGQFGDYIEHAVINQLALAMVGPHSFEVVDVLREADSGAVSGVLARLTVTIDGVTHTIVEAGDVDFPDREKAGKAVKLAASDAYKRCWMRFGLGLELWAQENWSLPAMLTHYHQQVEGQGSLL